MDTLSLAILVSHFSNFKCFIYMNLLVSFFMGPWSIPCPLSSPIYENIQKKLGPKNYWDQVMSSITYVTVTWFVTISSNFPTNPIIIPKEIHETLSSTKRQEGLPKPERDAKHCSLESLNWAETTWLFIEVCYHWVSLHLMSSSSVHNCTGHGLFISQIHEHSLLKIKYK